MAYTPPYPVYLAILPDHAAREKTAPLIRQVVSEHGLSFGLQDLERLHITMLHLGTWHGVPGDLLPSIGRMAAQLSRSPLRIRLDRMGNLGGNEGRKTLVLNSADRPQALLDLQRHLVFAAHMAGLRPKSQNFKPHMTLVYGHQQPMPTREIDPIEWTAHEVAVIQSITGRGRHIRLGSIPLRLPQSDEPDSAALAG